MKNLVRFVGTLTIICALAMCLMVGVFAHACTVESLGGTYIRFAYSDGTIMNGAKIIVKNAGGETIGTGKTDRTGTYDYAEFVGSAAEIMVNDGEGHALSYEVPAEVPPVTDQTPVKEETPAAQPESAPAEENETVTNTEPTVSAPAPAPAPEASTGSGMSGGTIAAVVIVVAAAAAIAVLFAKRGKAK